MPKKYVLKKGVKLKSGVKLKTVTVPEKQPKKKYKGRGTKYV